MSTVLYRTVEENLRVAMRCYARVNEAGEARDYPGITVTSSGTECAVFNSAMLSEEASRAELERRLALATVHFQKRGLGWTLWLCDDLLTPTLRKEVKTLLRNTGYALIAEPPGMYANNLQAPRRSATLDIRPVIDEATRLDFAFLSSRIFTLPFDNARMIYGGKRLWDHPMQGWLGYVGSSPVSLATVVIGGGAAGVYSVGTLPEYQGRGYAETLMRYGLQQVKQQTGIDVSVLQSTSQGMNLYLRMGYRVVTRFAVYLQDGPNR